MLSRLRTYEFVKCQFIDLGNLRKVTQLRVSRSWDCLSFWETNSGRHVYAAHVGDKTTGEWFMFTNLLVLRLRSESLVFAID